MLHRMLKLKHSFNLMINNIEPISMKNSVTKVKTEIFFDESSRNIWTSSSIFIWNCHYSQGFFKMNAFYHHYRNLNIYVFFTITDHL